MSLEHRFTCPLPNGVHARPASALEEVARDFLAEITLVNQRTGRTANSKSVLAIVGADIRFNDPCVLTVSGPDEREAAAALSAFLQERFGRCDDVLPAVTARHGDLRLPPALRGAGVVVHRGTIVVPGIAQGRVIRAGGFAVPASLPTSDATDPESERQRVEVALQQLIAGYDGRISAAKKGIERDMLCAHRSMARDLGFRQQLLESIAGPRRTAAGAIADAEAYFTAMLNASGSALLRERALDIQEICVRLLRLIYGETAVMADIRLDTEAVVVAESLTPGQFLALDRHFLKGLVLAQTSTASHAAILARSFGVPTLTGVRDLAAAQLDGQEAIVDAEMGVLVTQLTDPARRYYAMERQRLASRTAQIRLFAERPAATRDGHQIEIAANIATADEAIVAFAAGAEGVAVFRTEMLFLDRASAPGEAEQFEAYRRVLAAAGDRPVVIRTLDIGGDKRLDYLHLPAEENPFLGCRAVRIYREFEWLFRAQVRAQVRASAHGRLKVMVPMIATVDEVRWVKKIIGEEQARCAADGIAFDPVMPVGAMIEVPSAAFALDTLCRELDFFSIGSNDLLQYFMAADRANPRVADLYNPLQPAFLRLLKQIVDCVHAHHKWVGLCGEMGGQTRCLPLLVGLGLDEIGAAGPAVADLKAELAALTLSDCRQLLAAALECATADEVACLLERFSDGRGAALLAPELVITDADAATKEEAVKLAVDRLYVLGRTSEPHALEDAVWQREAAYSTAFGHGFAIPHCKTDAVRANSLALVKLRSPVVWDAPDARPVRVVILLAVRESAGAREHMKVLAKLARLLMHDDFRAQLERETDATSLCAFLHKAIHN